MPVDASIPLQVRTPEPGPNPLDALARVLQIKNEQARQQLIPGQVALQNQQVQLGQQQLDSTRVLNEAYKQPGMFVTGADGMPTMDTNALGKYLSDNGQGHLVPSITKTGLELNEAAGKVREQRSKLSAEEADYAGLVGAGAMTTAADGTKTADPGKLSLGLAHAATIYGPNSPSAQALQMLQQDPSKAQGIAEHLIQQSPKQRELATAAQTAAARKQTADNATAKLPGELALQAPTLERAQAEATLATAKANLLKDPSSYSAIVDNLQLPPDLANRTKAQVGFYVSKGLIDQANKVLDNAAETANAPGKAAAVVEAEIPAKVAAERATAPLKIQQAIQIAKALREGDNPALAGVPPALATQVQTAATKLDQDYVGAKTAADDIANLLKMARGGNVSAGANIPLAGVGAINAVNGIKRINQAEIQQYGTAGSLIQKIQGKLEGWTEGKPIPDSVLNDMAAVHEMLASGAYQKYTSNLAALNQRSGAKYGPAFEAPKSLGAGGAKTINTKAEYDALTKGATYIDAADGKQYQKK